MIPPRNRRRRIPVWVALMVMTAPVAGCTWLPDEANPVKWYQGARDTVSGKEPTEAQKQAEARAKPLPGEGKAFPNLATVPARPEVSSATERQGMAAGLIADRKHARYTDDAVRSGRPVETKSSSRPMLTEQPAPPAPTPPPAPPQSARVQTPPSAPVPMAAPPPPADLSPPPLARVMPPPAPDTSPPPQMAAASGESESPLPPLTFGPPPTDIAIAMDAAAQPRRTALPRPRPAQSIASDTSRTLRAPSFRRQEAALAGQAAVIHFAIGSSRLGAAARRTLGKVAAIQRSRGGALRIVGHASSRTGDMDIVNHNLINFQVSMDRAQAVARELMRLGVAPEAVRVGAESDAQPLFFEVMPAGEAGNRRVEIYLEG